MQPVTTMLLNLILLATLIGPVAGQDAQGTRAQLLGTRVDSIVTQTMRVTGTPGVSVGVMRGNDVLLAQGWGLADIERGTPATERTSYSIGSITKTFTAVATMILVEEGRIALDDPVTRHLTNYGLPGNVTVAHLLDHTSGLVPFDGNLVRTRPSPPELVGTFARQPLQFAPGTAWRYNNSAYYMLGLLIERVSGLDYESFLRTRIWEPLGMERTHLLGSDVTAAPRAQGYDMVDGQPVPVEPLDWGFFFSAGGLASDVLDLLRYQHGLWSGQLLTEESLRLMSTRSTLANGTSTWYGKGLALGEMDGHRKAGHRGYAPGLYTRIAHYPADDLTVVVLANTAAAWPWVPDALESAVAMAALGLSDVQVPAGSAAGRLDPGDYVGRYRVTRPNTRTGDFGGPYLEVSRTEDGAFTISERNRPEPRFIQVAPDKFHLLGDPHHHLSFRRDGTGRVVRLELEREGMTVVAEREPGRR